MQVPILLNIQALSALIQKFDGSPEAKFFIVKFLSRFPSGSNRINNFLQFSKSLGFTKAVATRSVFELIEMGLLLEKRHQIGQKPFRILRLSPTLEKLIHEGTKENPLHHQQHMNQLLVWGEEPLDKRQHQLTINKRLVLLILLAHADKAGIVRTISTAKLSKCTGLTVLKVRSNIKLLKQNQYISSSIPGGNFPGTLGKSSSIYALNLRNLAYGGASPNGVTLLFRSGRDPREDLHEAVWLKRDINSLKKITRCYEHERALKFVRINGEDAGEFARYIHTKLSGPFLERLQWEMMDIASRVIELNSKTWDERHDYVVSELESRVFANLSNAAPNRTNILKQGVSVLYHYINNIFTRAKTFLQEAEEQVDVTNFYQFLPIQQGKNSYGPLAIEIDSKHKAKSNERKVKVLICDFSTLKVKDIRAYPRLDDISVDSRHEFAILTKPIKPPKLRTPPNRLGSNAIDEDKLP